MATDIISNNIWIKIHCKEDIPIVWLNSMIITLVITVFILILAVFLAIEASSLYKRILNQKERDYIDSIDDIKGQQDEGF